MLSDARLLHIKRRIDEIADQGKVDMKVTLVLYYITNHLEDLTKEVRALTGERS